MLGTLTKRFPHARDLYFMLLAIIASVQKIKIRDASANRTYKFEPILIRIKVVFIEVRTAILPVYNDLCKRENLSKCLHGRTQNRNESFNGMI